MQLRKGAVPYPKIQIRIGSKKFDVNVDAHMLQSDDKGMWTWISVPAVTAIFGITSNGSELIKDSEAPDAIKALKKAIRDGKAPKGKKAADAEIPAELAEALKKLPAGYRLVVQDGEAKLQKLRAKREKASGGEVGTPGPKGTRGKRGGGVGTSGK